MRETAQAKATHASSQQKELPSGWRWVRLVEVCEIIAGQSPPGSTYRASPEGLPFFQGKADFGLLSPVPRVWCVEPNKIALPGDILISVRAPVGPTNVADVKCCIGRGLAAIRCDGNTDSDFILSALQHFENKLIKKGSGSTFEAISRNDLEKLAIPLPPLVEQRRIAGVLREQMAAVEKARAAAQARLEAVKALPASFLRQVFNGPDAQTWPRMKFEQVSLLQRGHDLPEQERKPGPYPVVTSSGIVGTHDDFRARGPGVVTGRSGSVGRVHYIKEDFWPHNTALYVKDFKSNNPIYVFYLLQWVNVKAVSSGTGVPTLDRKEVHKLIVSHPSVREQERIVEILTKQIAAAEKARASVEAELNTINALPAVLLRRAFNGEL